MEVYVLLKDNLYVFISFFVFHEKKFAPKDLRDCFLREDNLKKRAGVVAKIFCDTIILLNCHTDFDKKKTKINKLSQKSFMRAKKLLFTSIDVDAGIISNIL